VGIAHSKDTAKINAYFATKQVKEVLPRDLGLRWTVKAIDERGEFFQLIAIKITNRDGRAPLAGDVITDAKADFSQTSAYANVSMTMNAEGAKIWARMTKDNIGKSIAIALDGYIYSFPTVNTEITGGSSQITGNFTVEEAKDLANTLKSGKMPAPARIVQEDVVGPSLGQDAINSGLISFVIAFVLVLLYMIFYYGKVPGLIADVALFANVFFLMGILASFSAVLTLPGIAGIVLTLGMAVDGNVIIYERIREELRAGKTMNRAITDGYKNAISAIVDGQLTTFITGVVLSVFGTGPIKGFANTLMIGIVTSFITSVFLTRLMLEMYAKREKAKELPFTTEFTKNWFQGLNINFIGYRKIAYYISAVLLLVSVISFATRGLNLGVDFSGGRNYVVRFDEPVKTAEVRDMLEGQFEGAGVQVITIGSENQVRISTKYKIEENSETVDNEIEEKLYQGLKPLLKADVTKDVFVDANIQSSQKVGPTIADDIKTAAVWAVIFALLAIGLYIFIRFREFSYALGATLALVHDAVITIGSFSLLYSIMPFSMEIDQSFIAAILTVVGYSVNDTVIVFDRIRENVGLYPKRDRQTVMNDAINSTLSRTFSTSMSTLVVLIAIFVLGGETIRGFVFAMLFGIAIGTYSSVFVASPITYEIYKRLRKKENAVVEAKK
jgi:SecD/SecF fusion protein